MTDGLVKRLRFALRDWKADDRFHFPSVNAATIKEAADRIERLQAELAKARAQERDAIAAGYLASLRPKRSRP